MSKHHRPYNNYYQNNKPEEPVTDAVVEEDEDVDTVAPVVDLEPEVIKSVIGTVRNCQALNVRKQPDKTAAVLFVLNVNDEVEIDEEQSTDNFYKVSTPWGLEGFCMKQFIAIKE